VYRFKKAYSYFVYSSVSKAFEEFKAKRMALLKDVFGNHEFCTDACPGFKALQKGETYNPGKACLDKKIHLDIYEDLKGILYYFTTDERIQQQLHNYSTQQNEASNNATTIVMAPKPKPRHYSSTCSLFDRAMTMIGTHNLCNPVFYALIFKCIGIHLDTNAQSFLENKR
jgi:hypothetical protein